jgi:Reverse transcriptase (RNA-dependent DNA polymerase)
VAKKVATTAIANFYEVNELLYKGQFGYRKQRNAIDAVTKLIYTTKKAWNQKKLLGALFMDVKDAFNYVVKERLLQQMNKLEIPQFLIN